MIAKIIEIIKLKRNKEMITEPPNWELIEPCLYKIIFENNKQRIEWIKENEKVLNWETKYIGKRWN